MRYAFLLMANNPKVMNVGIIAGSGSLPLESVGILESRGHCCFLVELEDTLTSPPPSSVSHTVIPWRRLSTLFDVLDSHSIDLVLLVGGIDRRPSLGVILRDWRVWKFWRVIGSLHKYGDDAILSVCIRILERRGYEVGSMSEHVPELVASLGANGKQNPSRRQLGCLNHGMEVLGALGRYDIGQSVVVVGDRVIAVEGAEGTDAMLERVVRLRADGRISSRGGVLVKRAKVGQDERADLPTIGVDTIRLAVDAGLDGIGVQSANVLIAERDRTIELADSHNIFVYGIEIE